jgi:uncharacterized membrane protein
MIINNFLHILAAIVWIGGMIYNTFVLFPSLDSILPLERGKLMGTIAARFTFYGWSSAVILLVTGLIRAPLHFIFNFSSQYGIFFNLKLLLYILMIAIGVTITFGVAQKLKKLVPEPGKPPSLEFINAQKNLKILGTTNLVLGVLIILCVVIMRIPI